MLAPPRKADAPDLEKKPQGNEPRLYEADLPQPKSGAEAMSNLAARHSLDALAPYEFRPADAVSPDVIMDLSSIAKPIFFGLRRVSDWAIAKYGKSNQTAAGRARVRALETGGTGSDSP